jgi:hypothetical protein
VGELQDWRDLPKVRPSDALVRRWKTMPPWQAKRARERWWRENGPEGQAPVEQVSLPERRGPRESISGSRRLTNDELAARTTRKVELDNPAFDGTIAEEDLKIASPATVKRWLEAGKIYRDLGGPPPSRQH